MVDAVGGPWQTPADAITLGRHLERYGPAILRGSGVGREHRRSDARRDDRVAGDRERPRPRSRPPRTRRRPGRGGDRAAHSARQRHLRRRGPGLRPPVRRRPPAPRRLAGRLSTIRCGVRWSQLHDRTTAYLRTVMGERIYTRSAEGGLEPLEAEPFSTEDELQELIANHPELLDGEQVRPDAPRRWILVTREKGIAEAPGAGARWALDHLIVDQDARPTLVEVKRGSNSEIRRTVVGQLLEYAANAAATWSAEDLRTSFEATATKRGLEPAQELERLLETDRERDADSFWDDVATNLVAHRLRLLFVADDIPDELERIVRFLNASMPDIEVLAVEVKQFRGDSSQTLVPRVIGRSAAAVPRGSRPRRVLTQVLFLEEFPYGDQRDAARHLLDVAEKHGGKPAWGATGVSIRVRCPVWNQPVTVAWLYPPSTRGWMRTRDCTFGASISFEYPLELYEVLKRWIDQFAGDDFLEDASSEGVEAKWAPYDAVAEHIVLVEKRLGNVLEELASLKEGARRVDAPDSVESSSS